MLPLPIKKIDLCMANMCYLKKNLPKKRAV